MFITVKATNESKGIVKKPKKVTYLNVHEIPIKHFPVTVSGKILKYKRLWYKDIPQPIILRGKTYL